MVSRGIDWYLETLATGARHVIEPRLVPLLRRTAVVLIYGIGGLLILDLLEINISPLIAGLGLGGLAVALAIQPTLANLFAGTYVMTEGVISPGDYIELEGSIAGYVIEVGWRSTRIRTWRNNLVVVPNNKFAESILTNYQRPAAAVNVWLTCGVSYDSDLYQVENVCREVMDELLETEPDAVKEYGGWFGFDNFGDSNVNFWLFVQARDRLGSFALQTSLMQRLHQRLRDVGIAINYPVRTLQLPKEWSPETMMRARAESNAASRPDGRDHRRRGRRRRLPRDVYVRHDDGEDGPEGEAGPTSG
jgi:small-conductance mechanosensitive channel